MEAAVFRPALRNVLFALLTGAAGGGILGAVAGVPFLLSLLFGAGAAALAIALRQLSGLRVIATESGLAVKGRPVVLEARWEELRLGFGRSPRPGPAGPRPLGADDGRLHAEAVREPGEAAAAPAQRRG